MFTTAVCPNCTSGIGLICVLGSGISTKNWAWEWAYPPSGPSSTRVLLGTDLNLCMLTATRPVYPLSRLNLAGGSTSLMQTYGWAHYNKRTGLRLSLIYACALEALFILFCQRVVSRVPQDMKMWFKMLKKQLISLVIIIQLFVCATTKNFIHEREERDIFSSSRLHPFERVRRSVPNKFNNVRFRRSANSDDPDSVNTNPDEGKCRNPLEDDNLKQIVAKEVSFHSLKSNLKAKIYQLATDISSFVHNYYRQGEVMNIHVDYCVFIPV